MGGSGSDEPVFTSATSWLGLAYLKYFFAKNIDYFHGGFGLG